MRGPRQDAQRWTFHQFQRTTPPLRGYIVTLDGFAFWRVLPFAFLTPWRLSFANVSASSTTFCARRGRLSPVRFWRFQGIVNSLLPIRSRWRLLVLSVLS